MEILMVMPDYVYYIIGAGLAILVMLLIIAVSSKPSKKNQNNCEVKEESEVKEQEVLEEKTEENMVEEKPEEKVKEENEESQPQEEEPVKEENVEEQPKEPAKEEITEKTEEKEMSKKEKLNRYRVTYDKEQGNWVVKMDGADRASRRCATKEEALKVAKELAEKKDASLSVHKKDGKFQKKANIK